MQTCACPRCGAPLPLSLASALGVRCGSCGYEGLPRPEVLERLRWAHAELARLDRRALQLDADGRAAVGRALRTRWVAWLLLGVGALPFVALSAVGLKEGIEHDGPIPGRVFGVFFIAVPMFIHAGVGSVLSGSVSRAFRRLLAASAAIPPERPGAPITCAICGAALAPQGVEPVARCGYCTADNVVHPKALALVTARRATDIDALGATTARRAHEATSAARYASTMGIASVVGTPFAAFFSVLGMLLAAKAIEPHLALSPSPMERYAWVETKRGTCVGLIAHRDGTTEAYFGGNNRIPNPMPLDALPPRFAPTKLVGRTLRLANGTHGRVVSITGSPVTNREQVVLDSGIHGDLAGSCSAESSDEEP